jgi:MSHA biogenesis protein MshP
MNARAQGFSLVSAIFLLVVLALLGTYMVTIGTVQRQTSSYSILGSRAVYAADSGVQWAIRSVLTNGSCAGFPASFTLSGGATDGFRIAAECSLTTYTENPVSYNVYSLLVTARLGNVGDPDYISRTIRARVTDAP